eukprot:scaffold18630_cov64-Cyclotella_meneghiniana.AAC.1
MINFYHDAAEIRGSHPDRPPPKPDWFICIQNMQLFRPNLVDTNVAASTSAISSSIDRHENRRIRLFRRRCHDTRDSGRPRTPRRTVSSRSWTPATGLEPLGLICPKPGCANIDFLHFCHGAVEIRGLPTDRLIFVQSLRGFRSHHAYRLGPWIIQPITLLNPRTAGFRQTLRKVLHFSVQGLFEQCIKPSRSATMSMSWLIVANHSPNFQLNCLHYLTSDLDLQWWSIQALHQCAIELQIIGYVRPPPEPDPIEICKVQWDTHSSFSKTIGYDIPAVSGDEVRNRCCSSASIGVILCHVHVKLGTEVQTHSICIHIANNVKRTSMRWPYSPHNIILTSVSLKSIESSQDLLSYKAVIGMSLFDSINRDLVRIGGDIIPSYLVEWCVPLIHTLMLCPDTYLSANTYLLEYNYQFDDDCMSVNLFRVHRITSYQETYVLFLHISLLCIGRSVLKSRSLQFRKERSWFEVPVGLSDVAQTASIMNSALSTSSNDDLFNSGGGIWIAYVRSQSKSTSTNPHHKTPRVLSAAPNDVTVSEKDKNTQVVSWSDTSSVLFSFFEEQKEFSSVGLGLTKKKFAVNFDLTAHLDRGESIFIDGQEYSVHPTESFTVLRLPLLENYSGENSESAAVDSRFKMTPISFDASVEEIQIAVERIPDVNHVNVPDNYQWFVTCTLSSTTLLRGGYSSRFNSVNLVKFSAVACRASVVCRAQSAANNKLAPSTPIHAHSSSTSMLWPETHVLMNKYLLECNYEFDNGFANVSLFQTPSYQEKHMPSMHIKTLTNPSLPQTGTYHIIVNQFLQFKWERSQLDFSFTVIHCHIKMKGVWFRGLFLWLAQAYNSRLLSEVWMFLDSATRCTWTVATDSVLLVLQVSVNDEQLRENELFIAPLQPRKPRLAVCLNSTAGFSQFTPSLDSSLQFGLFQNHHLVKCNNPESSTFALSTYYSASILCLGIISRVEAILHYHQTVLSLECCNLLEINVHTLDLNKRSYCQLTTMTPSSIVVIIELPSCIMRDVHLSLFVPALLLSEDEVVAVLVPDRKTGRLFQLCMWDQRELIYGNNPCTSSKFILTGLQSQSFNQTNSSNCWFSSFFSTTCVSKVTEGECAKQEFTSSWPSSHIIHTSTHDPSFTRQQTTHTTSVSLHLSTVRLHTNDAQRVLAASTGFVQIWVLDKDKTYRDSSPKFWTQRETPYSTVKVVPIQGSRGSLLYALMCIVDSNACFFFYIFIIWVTSKSLCQSMQQASTHLCSILTIVANEESLQEILFAYNLGRQAFHSFHILQYWFYNKWFVRSFHYDCNHTAKLERECDRSTKYLPVRSTLVSFDGVLPISNAVSRLLPLVFCLL